MKRQPPLKSRIVFDKEYKNTIDSLKKIKLIGHSEPTVIKINRTDTNHEGNIKKIQEELVYTVNCKNGEKLVRNFLFE